MKISVVRPDELDSDTLVAWRRIQDSNPVCRSPFYCHQFTRAVGQARDDAFVGIIETDGQISGFLPFHRLRGGIGKPIGGPISDYHGPILSTEVDIAPQQLLLGCGLAAYDYNHLPVEMGRFGESAYDFTVSPYLDLSEGYEAYVKGRTSSWRKAQKDVRRNRKRVESEFGSVELRFHDSSASAFKNHVGMKAEALRRAGAPSFFDVTWIAETLKRLHSTVESGFSGSLAVLQANGRTLASHFGLRAGDKWHYWFPSYDQSLGKYGLGSMLLFEAVSRMAEEGVSFLDFGRGEEAYKQLHANGFNRLCEGSFGRRATLAGGLRKLQRTVVVSAKALPLGRYENYPQRALSRLISGVRLPEV